MTYLTRDNKPAHITGKMRAGYIKARREWITFNDAYNVSHFGITQLTYAWILRACHQTVGAHTGETPPLSDLNRWLKGDSHLYDAQGRLLP